MGVPETIFATVLLFTVNEQTDVYTIYDAVL